LYFLERTEAIFGMDGTGNIGAGGRSLLIGFGSQTGTAQEVAAAIARQSLRFHFRPRLESLDSYALVRLTKILIYHGSVNFSNGILVIL
jgi:sulfite reductase alpha subunit-like flavoprotein